jgi:predicted dehydrogenase
MKVGIIGTGFSGRAHIEALKRIRNVEITGIYARDFDKASEIAEEFNIEKAYDDYYALIDDENIEVIHNCMPNHLHYDINAYVLDKGKHLMSEKPLALTSEESASLVEKAAKSNSITGVCFNYRFYPMIRQMKKLFSENTYGHPHLVRGGYIQDWLLYDTDYSWRLEPELNGKTRAIADIGSHWMDTIQHIFGRKIVSVFADLGTVYEYRHKPQEHTSTFSSSQHTDSEKKHIDTEDFGTVLVKFEDGVKGVFTVSQVTAGRKNHFHFEIASQKAALYWDQETPNELWVGKRDKANEILMKDPGLLDEEAAELVFYPGGHQEGWPDALKNLFADFYRNIESGEKDAGYYATFEEGHYIMKLIDAILESHQKQQWVNIF